MKKHIIVWSIAIGLLVGTIVALLAILTPVRRFPVGVVAMGDDDAMLFTRFVDTARVREFVERIADGDTLWSVEVTPLQPAEGFDRTAMAIAGERVVMLGTDGQGADFAVALDLADGHLLWRIQLPGVGGPEVGGRLDAAVQVDDQRAYLVHDVVDDDGLVHDHLEVVALDSGATLWTLVGVGEAAPGRLRFDVRLRSGSLVISGVGAPAVRLDPATGARQSVYGFESVLCEDVRGLVGVGADALVWAPDGASERRIDFGPDSDLTWTTTCGFRGDDLIVNFSRTFAPRLARVAVASGAIVWERALGPGAVMEGPLATGPRLPRLLPVSMCGQAGIDGPNTCVVVVADLDTGEIVQRHRTERAESARPIVTPDRAWLWVRHAGTLVGLDPATGALVSGLRMNRFVDIEPQTDDLHGHRLWFAPHLVAHSADLPWVVVDLDSGAIAGQHGDVHLESVPPVLGEPDPTL